MLSLLLRLELRLIFSLMLRPLHCGRYRAIGCDIVCKCLYRERRWLAQVVNAHRLHLLCLVHVDHIGGGVER